MSTLTRQQQEEIVARLQGTSGVDDFRIAEDFDIELDDLEEIASEHGLERCKLCDWWFEAGELNDDYECEDCQPSEA